MDETAQPLQGARFAFDPFAALLQVFERCYPAHPVRVEIKGGFAADAVHGWGATVWPEAGGTPVIYLDPVLPYGGLIETLAHELAHVVAGAEAGHGEAWKEAYGRLRAEWEAEQTAADPGRQRFEVGGEPGECDDFAAHDGPSLTELLQRRRAVVAEQSTIPARDGAHAVDLVLREALEALAGHPIDWSRE